MRARQLDRLDAGELPRGRARPVGADRVTATSAPADRRTTVTRTVVAVTGLVAFIVFSLSIPYFLSVDNLINLLNEVALAGIVAMPATFLIMSGQVDLSVGATAAFVGIVLAATTPGSGLTTAVLLAVGAGLLIGLANGLLVTAGGVNSIAATFASMALLRGLAYLVPSGLAIVVSGFRSLGNTWSSRDRNRLPRRRSRLRPTRLDLTRHPPRRTNASHGARREAGRLPMPGGRRVRAVDQPQSMQIAHPPAVPATRLRCWTRKQDPQVNSSARFGITGMTSSSPDRSAPGNSTPSWASTSSRSTFGDCASARTDVIASNESIWASPASLARGAS